MREVAICATLSPFTRDDPRYWHTRANDDHPQPADHTEAGFFAGGPGEPMDPVEQKMGDTVSAYTPETRVSALARTHADRAFRRRVLTRQLSFVQAAMQTSGPFVRRGPTRWKVV
jgi:hypothetical protein